MGHAPINGSSARPGASASRPIAVAVLLAAALWPAATAAAEPPSFGWHPADGLTLGPSIAAVRAPALGWAAAPGAELTYFRRIRAPLYYWLSAGARLLADAEGVAGIPYVETGLSVVILEVGVGYGRGIGDDRAPRDVVHGFVALAIPLFTPGPGHLLYVEPYYRPCGALTPERFAFHELGLLLKWLWMLRPASSSEEDAIPASP